MSGSVCKGHVMYSMCEHAVTRGQELWSANWSPHSLPSTGQAAHIAAAETLWNACIAVSSHTIYCGRHKSLNWNDSSASLCRTVEAFKSNGQYFTRFWQVGWLSRLFGTGHLCRSCGAHKKKERQNKIRATSNTTRPIGLVTLCGKM